jgi:hypothetical protein
MICLFEGPKLIACLLERRQFMRLASDRLPRCSFYKRQGSIRAIARHLVSGSLSPLEYSGELRNPNGYCSKVDMLHVTNSFHSLSRWKKSQVDCVTMDEWLDTECLPSTMDLPLGSVISKSWSCQFETLHELRHAVVSATFQELTIPQPGTHLFQKHVFIVCALACTAMLVICLRSRIR